jgi:hypothetical protein
MLKSKNALSAYPVRDRVLNFPYEYYEVVMARGYKVLPVTGPLLDVRKFNNSFSPRE